MISPVVGLIGVLASPALQVNSSEIDSQIQRFVSAVNSNDAAALAALYIRDPSVTSLGDGHITVGPSAVAALLESFIGASVRMTVDSVNTLPLGRDAAMASFRYRFLRQRPNPGVEWGAMTVVFVRTSAGWRVAHDHTSSLPVNSAQALPQVRGTEGAPPEPVRSLAECNVTRIVDGDTIHCRGIGSVRLIGMDTPEADQAPFGAMATEALQSLIPVGSTIGLERDVEARDRYGRVLGYLWSGDLLVNWWMVRQGWAVVLTYPPNVQYVEWFTDAQSRAQAEATGLWSVSGFACEPRAHRRGQC